MNVARQEGVDLYEMMLIEILLNSHEYQAYNRNILLPLYPRN